MTQKRTFTLTLKNDQTIVLEFAPIAATGDRLWQMFATTEALDTVDHIIGIGAVAETKSETKPVAKTKVPAKSVTKPTVKKKK